jgi:mgtE-like transporter
VSVLGDVLTLPALYLATFILGYHIATPAVGIALGLIGVVAIAYGLRSRLGELRRIVRESMPILVAAGCISAGAGIALEKSFAVFDHYPALLVMQPAHLSTGGALGGVLAGRLSTKMLLGLADPTPMPGREARRDIGLLFLLALPAYLFNAVGADIVAGLIGAKSPGLWSMVGASLIAGMVGMTVVVSVAYYSTILAVRTGLDPDNYGIPAVSSTVDFFGAITLIVAIAALGIR